MADDDTGKDQALLIKDSLANSLDTVVHQLRLLHELKQGRTPASRPHLTTDKGLEEFLFDLARLSVTTHQQFLRLGEQHFPDIVEVLRTFTNRPAGAKAGVKAVDLSTVTGKPNHTVRTKAFCIENPFDASVCISFSNPEFSAENEEAFTVGATFECVSSKTTYGPGESISLPATVKSADFRLVIPLAEKHFHSGTHYSGSGQIFSAGRVVGRLCVQIDVR